jgi:molecular chaperone HscA
MLQLTENFMYKHAAHISDEEKNATSSAISNLQTAISEKDKNKIMAASEHLNTISAPFAERVMDIAVAAALKGKGIL